MAPAPMRVPPNWWALQRTFPREWLPAEYAAPRDPVSLGVAILVNVGYTGAISGIGAALLGGLVIGGIALGAALLINAFIEAPSQTQRGSFTPQGPAAASDRQSTLRQSVGPRVRYYGKVKVGGTRWFFESKSGTLYVGITINAGQISAYLRFWFGDTLVTRDGSGFVQEEPWLRPDDSSVAKIDLKDGSSSQTVHADLDATFAEVTSDHRLRGIANILAQFTEVSGPELSEVYPQGDPGVAVEINASTVLNVRTGATEWSENLADHIYDYLTAVDGAGFPYGAGYSADQVDLASFQDFAEICDEDVPLAAGGTIKRYRYWGGYALNEEHRTVLGRMLACGDAELYINTDGKIAIRGGRWVEPALTLDDSLGHIISADFRQMVGRLAAFNELTIIYTDPDLDYQEVEGEVWRDLDNIALVGEVRPEQLRVSGAPHHAQARRLAKIYTKKRNPLWSGSIVTNFYGFNAIGEETVRVQFSPLGIDATFLIQSVTILDDMTGVRIEVTSLDSTAYDWDAETEEGTAPTVPEDTTQPLELDPPDDIDASTATRELNGEAIGAYIVITWTPWPLRPALGYEVEYKHVDDASWQPAAVDDSNDRAQTGLVDDEEEYEVRVRTVSPAGMRGEWSTPVSITVTADPTPPGAMSSVVVTGGNARASIAYTAGSSSHQSRVSIYRVPAGGVLDIDAHEITNSPFAAGPGASATEVDGAASPPSNILSNPGFGSDTVWSKGTGWTISGGKGNKAAGTASSLTQTVAGVANGDVLRIGFTVSNYTAGVVFAQMTGASTQNSSSTSANGVFLATINSTAANTAFGIRGDASFDGSVDDAVFFEAPVDAAPQGVWDYYVIPRNSSGVAGPTSGPHQVVVY